MVALVAVIHTIVFISFASSYVEQLARFIARFFFGAQVLVRTHNLQSSWNVCLFAPSWAIKRSGLGYLIAPRNMIGGIWGLRSGLCVACWFGCPPEG